MAGARDGRAALVLRGPHAACVASAQLMRLRTCVFLQIKKQGRCKVCARVPICTKIFPCTLVYPCSGLVASPIVTPPSCCSTAGRPTLPSCHWGSPRPLGLAELAFWALPHQSSLAAAALSCALADGIGVGQSHSSCDCVWGRWGGGG